MVQHKINEMKTFQNKVVERPFDESKYAVLQQLSIIEMVLAVKDREYVNKTIIESVKYIRSLLKSLMK